MPDPEGGFVALFIDWDNIAIATAADYAGATPDLRRIVEVAQSHGTVLMARAYAEWGITSDRLAVYRAGIEPVYAPTFRFEADIPGQPSRGKSLADPCLVADCVDTLHLHPNVTTLVIVSGDKDLIPVVRLAQLRGKRVVVIGPDLVAAVLRDMADEYVPYRSLISGGEPRATTAAVRAEAEALGRRRRRGGRGGRGGRTAGDEAAEAADDATPPAPQPSRLERRERPRFADRAGVFRERAETPPPPAEDVPALEAPAAAEPEAPELDVPERPEPIRRERPDRPASRPSRVEPAPVPLAPQPVAAEGTREELFTAVTAILKERISSGRPRLRATNLKDYLIARLPGFTERRFGFERFNDLLDEAQNAGILHLTQEGQVRWIEMPSAGGVRPSALAADPVPAAAPAEPAPAQPERGADSASSVDADVALSALVELRHRSRALTQGLVNSTLTSLASSRGATSADEDARLTLEALVSVGAIRLDREPQEVEINGAKHRVRLAHLVDDHDLVQAAEARWREQNPQPEATAEAEPAAEEPEAQAEGRARRTRGSRGGRGRGSRAAESVPTAEAESPAPAEEPAAESPAPPRRSGGRAPAGANGLPGEIVQALVSAVRESIAPGKDTAGAAGVKSRLTRAVPEFDERAFGFSKFKDFLLAAEKQGQVRVESVGGSTRVGLAGADAANGSAG